MKTSNFSRYLTQYLTHYLPVQRNLSSNTIRSYRDTIHAYAQALRSYRQSGEAIEVLALLEAFLAGNLSELPDNDKTRALLRDMAKIKPQPPLPVEQPHIINSAGINNCGGKCKINITVAEGCALEISTDDSDNDPQIRACLRGRGYRRTFLTPKRLRYPMKRVGERGSGKFERIRGQRNVLFSGRKRYV